MLEQMIEGEARSDDVSTRQIVVATLNFVSAEIRANLQAAHPDIAAVLHMIEGLASEMERPLSKKEVAETKLPADAIQEIRRSAGAKLVAQSADTRTILH